MSTIPNYPLPPDDRFDTAMVEVVADYFAYRGYEPYIAEGSPDFERLRAALLWFLYGTPVGVTAPAAEPEPSQLQVVDDYAARIREYPDHAPAITLGIVSALVTPGLRLADPVGRIRAALAALDIVRAESRDER